MAVIIVMSMGCRSVTNIVETDRLRNFPAEINAGDIVHVATGEKITFSQLADSFDGTIYIASTDGKLYAIGEKMEIYP